MGHRADEGLGAAEGDVGKEKSKPGVFLLGTCRNMEMAVLSLSMAQNSSSVPLVERWLRHIRALIIPQPGLANFQSPGLLLKVQMTSMHIA